MQKREVAPTVEIRFSGSVRISPFDSREGSSRKNGAEVVWPERKDTLVLSSIAENGEKHLRWAGRAEEDRRKCCGASDTFFKQSLIWRKALWHLLSRFYLQGTSGSGNFSTVPKAIQKESPDPNGDLRLCDHAVLAHIATKGVCSSPCLKVAL